MNRTFLQKGLSLIESAMVLALSALVVAGVMAYYQAASTQNKVERSIAQIMQIVTVVNKLYISTTDYASLSNKIIYAEMPAQWKEDPAAYTLRTPFNGHINVSWNMESQDTNTWMIRLKEVPNVVCQALATKDFGSVHFMTTVNSQTVDLTNRVKDASRLCHRDDGKNWMTVYFRR